MFSGIYGIVKYNSKTRDFYLTNASISDATAVKNRDKNIYTWVLKHNVNGNEYFIHHTPDANAHVYPKTNKKYVVKYNPGNPEEAF